MKAQASTQMKLCQQAAVVPYCGVKIWKIMEMTTLTYLSLQYKTFMMKYFLKAQTEQIKNTPLKIISTSNV